MATDSLRCECQSRSSESFCGQRWLVFESYWSVCFITTLSWRDFIRDICHPAVAQPMVCRKIGALKTTDCDHQCLLLWMLLGTRVHAMRSVHSSFLNGRRLFFWFLLKPCPSRSASFLVDVVRLPTRSDLIIPGPSFLSWQALYFLWLSKIQHAGFLSRFQVSICRPVSSALSVSFRLSLFCFIVCLRYLAFACRLSIGPCVTCVLLRLLGGMICVLLLHPCGLSVVNVVYHEVWSTGWSMRQSFEVIFVL